MSFPPEINSGSLADEMELSRQYATRVEQQTAFENIRELAGIALRLPGVAAVVAYAHAAGAIERVAERLRTEEIDGN